MAILNLYGSPLVDTRLILGTSNFLSQPLNASNNALASFFVAEGGHGGLVGGLLNCTLSLSSPVLRISLQGAANRITPDGTVKGGGSPASATFTPAVGFSQITFANSYNPTAGEILSLVCEYSSGTIGGSNRANIAMRVTNLAAAYAPYYASRTAGTWAQGDTGSPAMAPVYADGYVGRGFFAAQSLTDILAASTLYGSIWTPTMASVISGVIVGVGPSMGSNLQVTIYEGASTTISATTIVSQSAILSLDNYAEVTTTVHGMFIPVPVCTLKANTTYRIVVANSGSAYTRFASASFDRQSALQAAWGPLAGTIGASGTWTDYMSGSDLRAMPVIPCVDSVSGGGLLRKRDMSSGGTAA